MCIGFRESEGRSLPGGFLVGPLSSMAKGCPRSKPSEFRPSDGFAKGKGRAPVGGFGGGCRACESSTLI